MARMFEGPTEAEAAIKACEELDIPRSQLKYHVLQKSEDSRHVVIEVDETVRLPGGGNGNQRSPDRGDRGFGRGPGSGRGGRPGGRRDDRGGGRRDDRSGRGMHSGRGGGGGRDEGDEEGFSENLAEEYKEFREMTAAPKEPVTPKPALDESGLGERARKALEAVRKFLELGGFEARAQISVDADDQVVVDMYGKDEGLLIGRKGETLLALQFVINRLVGKDADGPERVALDCESYRERRQEALRVLALKLGEKAKSDGKIVHVSPMNAHDRRIFHVTLDGQNGLKTRSEGEGVYRRVLIVPDGAEDRGAHA